MDFDAPDRFVTGAVGEPETAVYYLQAVQGPRVVSVMLEREQVSILADRMLVIIDDLERRGLTAIDAGSPGIPAAPSLAEPVHEEFRVGTMTIAWDDDVDELVVEARSMIFDAGAGESALPEGEEIDEDDIPDDAPIGPDVLRVHLTPMLAQQFARRAGVIAADERARCPFCGASLEPTGHMCSRPDGGDHVH
jgi:uncharacterized repeat protein (TIGR03847 family)